ncbi:MAG: glycosyltransferase family 4 protein [Flavipsychrobacter sp.]|nr:glycosyltransferase family 4 protein [Flavipsychrobacter sp.]
MHKILFLNLTAFSQNGGIEKFNRCFLKALADIQNNDGVLSSAISMYDDKVDEKYYNNRHYKGFKGSRIAMILKSIWSARLSDTIVVGHINLSVIGVAIKMLYPKKKVVLVTHGIEVWEPLKGPKALMLKKADKILTVSNFTKQKICSIQNIGEEKLVVFPNTIDPFFAIPAQFYDSTHLRQQYGIGIDDPVLFTLARVSSTEKYKGYDVVLECLPDMLPKFPNLKYIIGGKYDKVEKARIDKLISDLKLEGVVMLTGFIKDEDLVAHYQMADMFIMPSRKEGFGIVFIEAMVCGLPVIAGNVDGSVDALKNGELGTLVNPLDKNEITQQLSYFMENRHLITDDYKYGLQQKTLGYFSFEAFTGRVKQVFKFN